MPLKMKFPQPTVPPPAQSYINVKGYKEFAAQNRPEGWNAWLTFAISPKSPAATPTYHK